MYTCTDGCTHVCDLVTLFHQRKFTDTDLKENLLQTSKCANEPLVLGILISLSTHSKVLTKSLKKFLCIKEKRKTSNTFQSHNTVRPHLFAPQIFSSLTFRSSNSLEQIYNNPTVHHTTVPSFIQFPPFIRNFHPERMCVDK